jgi:hypothetical protein
VAVAPDVAEQLVVFLQTALNDHRDTALTRAIYATIIECMANTNNHAFGVPRLYRQGKHWYAMAWNDKKNGFMEFAFIDTGAGIPKTVRKHWGEKLFAMIGKCSDANLIKAALEGKFLRSQTGLKQRGKGLPRIARHAADKLITRLMVRSLKGLVTLREDGSGAVDDKAWMFQGSLLSWRVRIPGTTEPQMLIDFSVNSGE